MVQRICNTVLYNRKRYEAVGKQVGCPWWFIAGLHYRESSLSFRGVLHNGEKIIGSGKKTSLVPKDRGPFEDWESAAVDALKLMGFDKQKNWSVYDCLKRAEAFNGLGYRKKIGDSGRPEYSPYVWAGTNHHDETSKYTSDGKYTPAAKEGQFGVAAIWKGLVIFNNTELLEQ